MREPLILFLVAGAGLFSLYEWLHSERDASEVERIVLRADDLRQIAVGWLAQGRPPPTADEMEALLERRVREEILYREALTLGLDRDDAIVRRRMVQKMEFLAQDLADLRTPTRSELEDWFRTNERRFAEPPRLTFRHLYFSPDRRGAGARDDAVEALSRLGADASPDPASVGDPFMFQTYYPDRSEEQLAKEFGPRFADAVFRLAPGAWHGPVESGFGWHLVRVDASSPARIPSFEEVEPAVRDAWMAEQRAELEEKAYETMRARYEIVLPEDPAALFATSPLGQAERAE